MSVVDRFRISNAGKVRLVRLLQGFMLLLAALGLYYGDVGVVVNAGVGLLVSFLPAILARNFRVEMGVGLVIWISLAMSLHALGTLPLPGVGAYTNIYQEVWWWDHMTHALSSSLVAGAAFATTRALDVYTDAIRMPPLFLFCYMLLFVLAFGVIWELIEFYIGVAATVLGTAEVLTQFGLEDTVLDMFYNTIGGLLVALFGTVYLTDVSDQLADRIRERDG